MRDDVVFINYNPITYNPTRCRFREVFHVFQIFQGKAAVRRFPESSIFRPSFHKKNFPYAKRIATLFAGFT
jgi:hypothetical protein